MTWQSTAFSKADIAAGAVRTVSTRDIAKATAASLIDDLDLKVTVGGLGLAPGKTVVADAVQGVLSAAAIPLDNLINGLTDLLGVHLGQADLRVGGLRCKDAALVA